MLRVNKGIWTLGIPVSLSLLAVLKHSLLLLTLLVLAHFVIIKIVPVFKGRESIWMFIFVAISSIPFNIYVICLFNKLELLFNSFFILGIFRCILYYLALFSVEEIIMGVVTRIIWKRQYKLDL